MTTRKGQVGPTPISAEAEATQTAPARLVTVTRQGVTLNLPAAFWPRLALYAIGVACLAGGYILMNVALEYGDDDDENDE